ncbi:M1 family metallopeptidase [candidate division KSB1 bacterium]|nr:M1 family metallopeptidase [candidate division KSB1 bacterium]
MGRFQLRLFTYWSSISILGGFHFSQAQPVLFEKPLSPRIANYDLKVRLHPDARQLHGTETLTWYNKTAAKVTELQFHLYLNAFRNNQSTYMLESRYSSDQSSDAKTWGYIEIERLTLESGEDWTRQLEFIQPDDTNRHDQTVVRLPLPKPLWPGKSTVLKIEFRAQLPDPPIARTGAKAEYFFVAQWFPKIGVFQDGQWNCHQFHANSEFFADFGVYNVWITVPRGHVVGATGTLAELTRNTDGTATHFYHAEDVHDFAWTASPEFLEVKGQAQDVDIRVLLQPDHAAQAQRHLDAAKIGVEYFQNWYGDYPFPNLTVVDPRRGAMNTGGMEYPTLITADTWYGLPAGIRFPEMVIIHEFGHNFWYHLVASNEFEEAWLDEGVNTYSEIQIFQDAFGPQGDLLNLFGLQINDLQTHRLRNNATPALDPIVKKSWEFATSGCYATNVYSKACLVLTTLQNYLGRSTMQKIMRTYFERYQFKHPKTQDFIKVANEIAGQSLDWFFEPALFSSTVLDYCIERAVTRPVMEAKGFDFTLNLPDTDSTQVANLAVPPAKPAKAAPPEQSDTATISPQSVSAESTQTKPKWYQSVVIVRRKGNFKFPVELLVTFENGEQQRETWDGQADYKKFTYRKPTRLASATVDPEQKIPLDVNFTNNSRTVKSQTAGINKLALRFLFWCQFLMDQPELLTGLTGLNFEN